MLNIPSDKPLPHSPGVYQFKDEEGKIIYIGKAKDLKKRISSYFSRPDQTQKTAALVKKIKSLDFILTDSEEEAILLESNLIKQYYPKYNFDLKDNSPLTYALFTKEDFPRLLRVRKDRNGKIRGPPGKVFGPFMSGSAGIIQIIRKTFGLRPCNLPVGKRLCLQYHLGNCSGACGGKISKEEYAKDVQAAEKIISNPKIAEQYVTELENKMANASKNEDFEKAIHLRNAIHSLQGLSRAHKVDSTVDRDEDYIILWEENGHARAQAWRMVHGVIRDRLKYEFDFVEEDAMEAFLERFYQTHSIPRITYINRFPINRDALERHICRLRASSYSLLLPPSRGQKKDLMRLIEKNMLTEKIAGADPALLDLQKKLKLASLPMSIECFDISNLQGKQIVASMVQLVNGQPNKNEYRKFKIRSVVGQDDFGSIKEAVFRRYRRLTDEGSPLPDMVLIDGGMGQLHSAQDALKQLNISLPLFALAKENEEIYSLSSPFPLRLAKTDEALHVLQRARNEAHRFVISYHKKLRGKEMFGK